MSAGRIVDAVISFSSAAPGNATLNTIPMTKIRIVPGIGVCVRGLTRRISWWAGKRASHDIAKTIREHAAITTVPAPKRRRTRSLPGALAP
nr:hypothetical protein [Streptomyces sp. LUP30]